MDFVIIKTLFLTLSGGIIATAPVKKQVRL